MLEPKNQSRLMRRRRLSRRQLIPAPPRPPESKNDYSSPGYGRDANVWQPPQPEYFANGLERNSQSRSLRRVGRELAPRDESPKFNLRYLLSNPASQGNRRSPQRGRETGQRFQNGARSRSDLGRRSQGQPTKGLRMAPGLQPVRPLVPTSYPSRDVSRSRLVPLPRPHREASQGQVRPLYPHSVPPEPPPKGMRRAQRRLRRPPSPLLYLTRLLILGVGVGAIVGTILSVWDPASREPASASQPSANPTAANVRSGQRGASPENDMTPGGFLPAPTALKLNQEMTPLATTVQSLTAQYTGLTPGVFLVDLDNGSYINLNGSKLFSAASMIKVPVFVAFLQDVDTGKIRLDEMLTMQEKDIAGGSGELQYQPIGSRYSALETAIKMITISDNTATNMLIAKLGGIETLNQRFRSWGLTNTVIRNPLPDLEGTNITTPKDLADLLRMVTQGGLLSLRSRDRLLEIMRNTVTNTLLPSGLDPGAIIAHKTGNIDTSVGDTGIVDMPNGKRYIVTVIIQRPANDDRAQEMIRQISRTVYQYLNQPQSPGSSSVKAPSPTDSAYPGDPATVNSSPADASSTPFPADPSVSPMGESQ